jgi:myo-inositol-1(or 4)-monophosphatase
VSRELGAACLAAAQAGAQVLLDLYERPRDIQLKGRIDLVTDADRAAEERVLAVLRQAAPGVKVLAEESGEHGLGDARFLVDPLDGTTNYAHGLPLFCCTVAAEVGGELVAGCTVDPMRGETFFAVRGEGAVLRRGGTERALRVTAVTQLVQALVCTGFPYGDREKLPEMIAGFGRFTELSRGTRRLGSAAIDLAYVAAGRLDAFWEQGLKPWDVAAGKLLVEEAGGLVTRFDGAPLALAGNEIAASGPGLHAAMLQVLREARATSREVPPAFPSAR